MLIESIHSSVMSNSNSVMLSPLQNFCLDAMSIPHGIVTKPPYAFITTTPSKQHSNKSTSNKVPIINTNTPKTPTLNSPQKLQQQTISKKPKVVALDLSHVQEWPELENQIQNCQRCEELTQTRSQIITGFGAKNADLLIVEEAPGYDEDIQGQPFVGNSGILYDNMLKAINLDRKQIYTTNIIKCLPPNNRDPHNEEVQNCLSFLNAQIKLIKPKLILALGRIAAQHIMSVKTPVGQLRGTLHTHNQSGTPILVSYHPAYLIRNPRSKQQAWEDLKQVHSVLNS